MELTTRDKYELDLAELVGQHVEALRKARQAGNWTEGGSLVGALHSTVEVAETLLITFDALPEYRQYDALLDLANVIGRNDQFGVRT